MCLMLRWNYLFKENRSDFKDKAYILCINCCIAINKYGTWCEQTDTQFWIFYFFSLEPWASLTVRFHLSRVESWQAFTSTTLTSNRSHTWAVESFIWQQKNKAWNFCIAVRYQKSSYIVAENEQKLVCDTKSEFSVLSLSPIINDTKLFLFYRSFALNSETDSSTFVKFF